MPTERHIVGFIGTQLPEDPEYTKKVKVDLARAVSFPITKWYVGFSSDSVGFDSDGIVFRRLIMDIHAQKVNDVVYMGDDFLPDDPTLVGEFFDAVMDHHVGLWTEQGPVRPERKLLAQIGSLLAEHDRTMENWWLTHRGHGRLYFDVADLPELRRMCEADGGAVAQKLLRQLRGIEIEESEPETESAPFGILVDADTREAIGPATEAQRQAYLIAGPGGIVLIDGDGNVLKDADGYEGTLRRVFVDLERKF